MSCPLYGSTNPVLQRGKGGLRFVFHVRDRYVIDPLSEALYWLIPSKFTGARRKLEDAAIGIFGFVQLVLVSAGIPRSLTLPISVSTDCNA